MKSLNQRLLKAALLLGIFTAILSCKKEKPTLAEIRVIDELNQSVADAMVILYPNPNPVLGQMVPADTLYTDSEGWAIFDYTDEFELGTAGYRVLDIQASKGALQGTGIIKIVEEEENKEAVVISLP
jgi:hypothetical protein